MIKLQFSSGNPTVILGREKPKGEVASHHCLNVTKHELWILNAKMREPDLEWSNGRNFKPEVVCEQRGNGDVACFECLKGCIHLNCHLDREYCSCLLYMSFMIRILSASVFNIDNNKEFCMHYNPWAHSSFNIV